MRCVVRTAHSPMPFQGTACLHRWAGTWTDGSCPCSHAAVTMAAHPALHVCFVCSHLVWQWLLTPHWVRRCRWSTMTARPAVHVLRVWRRLFTPHCVRRCPWSTTARSPSCWTAQASILPRLLRCFAAALRVCPWDVGGVCGPVLPLKCWPWIAFQRWSPGSSKSTQPCFLFLSFHSPSQPASHPPSPAADPNNQALGSSASIAGSMSSLDAP